MYNENILFEYNIGDINKYLQNKKINNNKYKQILLTLNDRKNVSNIAQLIQSLYNNTNNNNNPISCLLLVIDRRKIEKCCLSGRKD